MISYRAQNDIICLQLDMVMSDFVDAIMHFLPVNQTSVNMHAPDVFICVFLFHV